MQHHGANMPENCILTLKVASYIDVRIYYLFWQKKRVYDDEHCSNKYNSTISLFPISNKVYFSQIP